MVGGASSTAEERKTGSASSSADAQSHSAVGFFPLRELWEYVNAYRYDTRSVVDIPLEASIVPCDVEVSK